MSWGFKRKRDAINSRRGTNQRPPDADLGQRIRWRQEPATNANYIAITPTSGGIPPRVGTKPGEADCDIYRIDKSSDLALFENTDFTNVGATVLNVPVRNLTLEPIPGDAIIVIWQVGGHWIALGPLPCVADSIDIQVIACVLYTTAEPITGYFGPTYNADWPVDCPNIPPEATPLGGGDYSIEFNNPNKLTAVADAIIRIERKVDDLGGVVWELVMVGEDDQIARWCKTEEPSTGILYNATFWEGGDPTNCTPEPTVFCDWDCSCLKAGDFAIAHYEPEQNRYRVTSTGSSLLGEADTTDIVQGLGFDQDNGCQLNFVHQQAKVFFCGSQPALAGTSMPSETIKSITTFTYAGAGVICLGWVEVDVPVCGYGSESSRCVSICDILCDCPELIAMPEICDPPPIDCTCCECHFKAGVDGLSITLDGLGNSSNDIEQTSECTWLVKFPTDDPGAGNVYTWTVNYECDGHWTAQGKWPGPVTPGVAMSISGDGGCAGATLDDGTNTPAGATGTVTADGVPADDDCDPPPVGCCKTWSGDEVVTTFSGTTVSGFTVDEILMSHPPEGSGCETTIDVEVRIEDDIGGTCDVTAHMSLSYERDFPMQGVDTCMWLIVIPACPLINFPGATAFINSCLGSDCGDAPSVCDDWDGFTMQITDDDTSVNEDCEDPDGAGGFAAAMLESADGKALTTTPAKSIGLGDQFIRANPKMFVGCKCKQSVKHVMNRWTRGQVSQDKINRVASTILNKSPGLDRNELIELLERFINDEK